MSQSDNGDAMSSSRRFPAERFCNLYLSQQPLRPLLLSGFPRAFAGATPAVLDQFSHGDVTLTSDLHEKQLRDTQAVLMG